jgi:anti-sigma factor RsiW
MNCPIEERHPEILVAYVAGELAAETARALERHVGGCAACRPVVAGQSAVWKTLDAWGAPPVSPDFDRRLYRRIDEDARRPWWERLVRPFRLMPLRQVLPLTACAGLLLVAGLLLQNPGIIAPVAEHREAVRANQVENTLDDLDLLRQFGAADSAESRPPGAL